MRLWQNYLDAVLTCGRVTFVAGWRGWDKVPLKALATHTCWIDDDLAWFGLIWSYFCHSLERQTSKELLPGHSYGLFGFRMISIVSSPQCLAGLFGVPYRLHMCARPLASCDVIFFVTSRWSHQVPLSAARASRSLKEPQGASSAHGNSDYTRPTMQQYATPECCEHFRSQSWEETSLG